MTGYGKASGTYGTSRLEAEVRSLNSKSQDISVKVPPVFKGIEMEIRQLAGELLGRGKIDIYVNLEGNGQQGFSLHRENARAALALIRELEELAGSKGTDDTLSLLLRFPEVIQSGSVTANQALCDEALSLVKEACQTVAVFRSTEGIKLEADISVRISQIGVLLERVEQFENQRIADKKKKLQAALDSLALPPADPQRLEQEMIFYLEKFDFTEEKVRLAQHLAFFKQCMQNETEQGRKLGFICQEIGREINTLGSKAYDADIQKLVVLMKDELEKIREQLGNIL